MATRRPLPQCCQSGVLVAALGLCVTACADDDSGGAKQAASCSDLGAWSIANVTDASSGGVVGVFGDRVVGWSDPPGELRRLHMAGTCGEDQIDIVLEGALEGDGTTLVVGPDLIVQAEDAALRLDPSTGQAHKVFDAVFDTMHSTPAGIVALGLGGKLLLHPEPSNAAVEATVLLDGTAFLPRPDVDVPPPWPHLWTDGAQTFGLSVDFELMRVPLNGSEPQIELTEVQEFHILAGGRVAAWRGLDGDMLVLTDLSNDSEIYSAPQDDPNWNAQEFGSWALITTDKGRLVNLDSGNVIEPVDFNPTQMLPTNTDSALLVGTANGSVAIGYWLVGPDGQLSNFLGPDGCLEFDSKVTAEGVVIPEGDCDPINTLYTANDVMALHPFDGSAARPLGERTSFVYQALASNWIVSWDEAGGSGFGALSGASTADDLLLMADDVTIAPPVADGLDVYFFQDGRGIERYKLE